MDRKFGGSSAPPPFGEGERGPHATDTDIGKKLGAVPLWGGGAGFPSNTMWPGPGPTCKPSFILIRPTVWLQCTNVTDRQTGQTDRQRSDSIGRTVLETVAKNGIKVR